MDEKLTEEQNHVLQWLINKRNQNELEIEFTFLWFEESYDIIGYTGKKEEKPSLSKITLDALIAENYLQCEINYNTSNFGSTYESTRICILKPKAFHGKIKNNKLDNISKVHKPIQQILILYLMYLTAGILFLGSVLDTISSTLSLISKDISFWGTIVLIVLWLTISLFLKLHPLTWIINDNKTKLKGLNPKINFAILGIIIMLWLPRINDLKPILNWDFIKDKFSNNSIEPENSKTHSSLIIFRNMELPYLREVPILDKTLFIKYSYNDLVIGGKNIQKIQYAAHKENSKDIDVYIFNYPKRISMSIHDLPFVEIKYKDKIYSLEIIKMESSFLATLEPISDLTMDLEDIL